MNKTIDPIAHPEHSANWHSLPAQDVLRALAADHAGLSPDVAAHRR